MSSIVNRSWNKLEFLIERHNDSIVKRKKQTSPKKRSESAWGARVEVDWSVFRRTSPSPSPSPRKEDNQTVFITETSSRMRSRPPIIRRRMQSAKRLTRRSGIDGLSRQQMVNIYEAKCIDLGLPQLPDQERRFLEFCQRSLVDRKFSLRDSGLGANSAVVIGKILQNSIAWAFLDFSKNPLQDKGIKELCKYIARNSSLVSLDLSSNDMSQKGAKKLCSMLWRHPSIISLDLSSHEGVHRNRLGWEGARQISKLLYRSQLLQILNIAGTALGQEGVELVAEGLGHNKLLIGLNLGLNDIGPKPIEVLMQTVCTSNLQQLNLASNKIGDSGCDPLSLYLNKMYGPALLTKLDLSRNDISHVGINKIWSSIRYNGSLQQLNVEKNPLFAQGMMGFPNWFRDNRQLHTLNLNDCQLGPEGSSRCATGIGKNKGLKNLIMAHNVAGDPGALEFASALEKNVFLEKIDLSSNGIKEKGGLAIAESLRTANRKLTTLNLSDNNLIDSVGNAMADVTHFNHILLKIKLAKNLINKKYISEMNKHLSENGRKKKQSMMPNLRKELEYLAIRKDAFQDVEEKIQSKRKEVQYTKVLLGQGADQLDRIASDEESKFQKLEDEYAQVWQKSTELTIQADDLKSQLKSEIRRNSRTLDDLQDQITKLNVVINKEEIKNSEVKAALLVKRSSHEQAIQRKRGELSNEQGWVTHQQKQVDYHKKELDEAIRRTQSSDAIGISLQDIPESEQRTERRRGTISQRRPTSRLSVPREEKQYLASEKLAANKKNRKSELKRQLKESNVKTARKKSSKKSKSKT